MTNFQADKIIAYEKISSFIENEKRSGRSIALCHGVFDLLHPGHIRHVNKAKELADIVVVSITADGFVNKGPGRPAFNENLRAESIANLSSVDFVVITPFITAVEIIESIKPNYYIKGSDYSDEKKDASGNITRERETLEFFGGTLITTDEIVFSSSSLINKFIPNHSDEVNHWISKIKDIYTLDEILFWIDKISNVKVAVIGETIFDIYTDCETLGKSSKDPILCFNKGESVSYPGGVLAIGAHCNGLGATTSILTGVNSLDLENSIFLNLLSSGIKLSTLALDPSPTIKKERYIDSRTSTRVFELYHMEESTPNIEREREFIKNLKAQISSVDVVIVADYGHGFITQNIIKEIDDSNIFIALNVQANAGNRGMNSISRYPRANFMTFNGFEFEIEIKRQNLSESSFIKNLHLEYGVSTILITRGSRGTEIFRKGCNPIKSPAFAPYVTDRVGAGDALLSISSLLTAANCPPEIVGFLANVVGAWSVTFLGNSRHLEKSVLIKHVTSLLK